MSLLCLDALQQQAMMAMKGWSMISHHQLL
jgi:hypothetical protein